MNYNELKSYLTNTSDHSFLDIIDDIDELLVKYNLGDYLLQVEDILYTDSQTDDNEILLKLKNLFSDLLENILSSHGILINEDLLITEKLELCSGLLLLQDYSDKVIINDYLSLDISNEEKLSEILSLVTVFNTEKILTMLAEVSDALIGKIKDIIQVQTKPDDVEEVLKYKEKYSKFKNLYKNEELFSDRFVVNTETIGLPFEVYLNSYISEIKGQPTIVEKIGSDMIGMCLISSTEGIVQNIIKENIVKINNDVDFIVKVNIFVNQKLDEMVKNG